MAEKQVTLWHNMFCELLHYNWDHWWIQCKVRCFN